MKKIIIPILSLALATSATAQTLDRSIRPKGGPAPEIKLGKTESFTLANGMRVFVVENHKLPAVTVSVQLDIRPELEGDMAGYQEMVGELLTDGTKTRSKDALNEAIDNIGANIHASEDGIYGNSLKKHQTLLLELMSDILVNADFKQEELDKLKTQSLSGLEVAKNNPDAMLKNVTQVVNFGPNHPYGQVANEASVKAITLARCRNYYNTYFRPNVAYMAIVGDVTMAEMKPLIERYFSKWQKATVPVTTYAALPKTGQTRVALSARDAAVQSVFNITYPIDLQPGEPDVIKAKVANAILGGGSQGRLFLNLRETHGWTYGSYSSIKEDDLAGSFTGYAKCRNAVTDSSITEMIREMRRMQGELVSAEELKNRLTFMTGSFAMGLESPQTVAQYAINIERYKMPKDYYQNYLKNLNAVTPADVQAVSRKYITPQNANIIVVGSEEIAMKLAQFGQVEQYDNYGKPVTRVAQQAVPAGVTAEAVIKKYIDAMGGEKAFNSIKDIKVVRTANIQGMDITLTEIKKAPGMLLQTVDAMGMTVNKVAYNGTKGYRESQGQKAELTGAMLDDTRQLADITAVLHPEKYGLKHTLKGMEKVNGADVYVVETADAKGKKKVAYYDVNSGLLVKQIASVETPQGDATNTMEFADYKEVPGANGYKLPATVKVSGNQNATATQQSVEVNKGLPDSMFQ